MVFEVRAEDKELTSYQRKFSMKEILARLNAGGECDGPGEAYAHLAHITVPWYSG